MKKLMVGSIITSWKQEGFFDIVMLGKHWTGDKLICMNYLFAPFLIILYL